MLKTDIWHWRNCDSRSNFSEREKERHSFPFQNKMSFCFGRCFRPFFFNVVYLVFIAFEKVKRSDFRYTIQFLDLTWKLLFPVFYEWFLFSYMCVFIFRYHIFFSLWHVPYISIFNLLKNRYCYYLEYMYAYMFGMIISARLCTILRWLSWAPTEWSSGRGKILVCLWPAFFKSENINIK